MADDHRGSRPSITSIVRAVVENLDHPPPQVPPMNSNDASASVRSVNGINTELNRAFQIPRGRVTAASSGTTFATRLASGFNPQWNYTNTQQHRVNRRGRSRSACGRFQPYSRGTSRSSTSGGESVYYNDVCLLPSPSWESVPRGSTKLHLIQKGMFIDAWPISKTWEEADLKRGVAKLFERFLGQPPIAIGFEFVRSIGTAIASIKLQEGQQLSAKVLRHISGTSPIYVRALDDVVCNDEDPSGVRDIRNFIESKGGDISVRCNDVKTELEKMFPSADSADLAKAMQASSNIHEAIDILLNDQNNDHEDGDDDLMHSIFEVTPASLSQPALTRLEPSSQQASATTTRPESSTTTRPASATTTRPESATITRPVSAANTGSSAHQQLVSQSQDTLEECYPLVMPHCNPLDAIQIHRSRLVNPMRQDVSINRRSSGIMRDIFKMLKRGELDILKVPDINFVGEEGIDAEGLTKEFCALMMTNLQKGKGGYMLFEGAPDHLVPVISEEYYQSGFFRYAGQLIAMSILHGGLGMVGLARSLATFMVTDDIELGSCHLTIEDVPDYPTQEALSELQNASDDATLEELSSRDDISALLYQAGFGNQKLALSNKYKAIQFVLFDQVFKSRRDEIADLKAGLSAGGMLSVVRANTACYSIVFPLQCDVVMDADDFLGKLVCYSRTEREKEVDKWFKDYVKDLSKEEDESESKDESACLGTRSTLKNLVQFICGHPYLPSGDEVIKVHYIARQLPDADACFNAIKLPLAHRNYQSFKNAMNVTINCQHQGYGRG